MVKRNSANKDRKTDEMSRYLSQCGRWRFICEAGVLVCERVGVEKRSEVPSSINVRLLKRSGIFFSLFHYKYFPVICQPLFVHLMCDPKKMLYQTNTTSLWMPLNSLPLGSFQAGKPCSQRNGSMFSFPPCLYFFCALFPSFK